MKNIYLALILALTLLSCSEKQDPFLVTDTSVGALTALMPVSKLDSVFSADSIVKTEAGGTFAYGSNERYNIYEKGGKLLLTLTPAKDDDSIAVVESVQIQDARYKTEQGISSESDFKAIQDNYKISKITNSINNVLIFVDELNAYFVIDKKELPESLRYDISTKIEAVQIPDKAQVKYFMVSWDE